MTTSLPATIADIEIPDTALVRDATEFIRGAGDDLLFHHSRRVFLFGTLQGRRERSSPTSSSSTPERSSTTSASPTRTASLTCGSRSMAPTRPAISCSPTALRG